MKYILFGALMLLSAGVFGQNKVADDFRNDLLSDTGEIYPQNYADEISKRLNLSRVWTSTNNKYVLGYIGENYQRIRIKFLSVTRDAKNRKMYHVTGKSMVKNIVYTFNGTLNITIVKRSERVDGCYDEPIPQKDEFFIIGNYRFEENSSLPNTGVFEGVFLSNLFLDKYRKPLYSVDTLEICSDNYSNNKFVGMWTSFATKTQKVCTWGDYRIPFTKDLNDTDIDRGAGAFSPNSKYLQYGWQSYYDANNFSAPNDSAIKIEEAEWWK